MNDRLGRNAMVMAAGLGLRMRPLTERIPKPLVAVAGKPLIDHALDWLFASGVERVVVNSHYLAEQLAAHIAKRADPRIHLSYEETLFETGGGVVHALQLLGTAPFFVTNSDAICIDGKASALERLRAAWDDNTMDALLLLQPVENAVGYDGAGDFFLTGATPARRGASANAPYVFTGVQLLHPRLFIGAPQGKFSLNTLYDKALASGRLKALAHDGGWLHVGDAAGMKAAEAALLN